MSEPIDYPHLAHAIHDKLDNGTRTSELVALVTDAAAGKAAHYGNTLERTLALMVVELLMTEAWKAYVQFERATDD